MKVVNILLLEDDNLDSIDLKRSFDKMQMIYNLTVVKNGEEAIKLLKTKDEKSLPDITIVDLNMPRMNGLEFLETVRQNPHWKHLKCFILTTSEEKVDKEAAKNLGISGYIVKPLKLNNPTSMDAFNLMIDLMNMKN